MPPPRDPTILGTPLGEPPSALGREASARRGVRDDVYSDDFEGDVVLEEAPESFALELFDDEDEEDEDEDDEDDSEADADDEPGPLAEAGEERESVMYQPLPLNTMPTG